MNTFLPYPDFAQSVACLDTKRLGKQRIEAHALLKGAWPHHPCSKMWRGYERALADYAVAACIEWRLRGFKDSILVEVKRIRDSLPVTGLPPWLGRESFHSTMRANLLRKDKEFYSSFGWTEEPVEGYEWGNI